MKAASLSRATVHHELPIAGQLSDARAADPPPRPVERENPIALAPVQYIPPDLARSWLAWQSGMIADVLGGAVFVRDAGGPSLVAIAAAPAHAEGIPALIAAAQIALLEQRGFVLAHQPTGADGAARCDVVATPLASQGNMIGAVVLQIASRAQPQSRAVLQLLQWGGYWLENLTRRQATIAPDRNAMALAVECLNRERLQPAALTFANRLAEAFACERVTVGLTRGLQVRLTAMSQVTHIDRRTRLVRDIEAAMEEAVDQGLSVRYPNADSVVVRAHAELAKQHGSQAVLSVPLRSAAGVVGVVTLERHNDQPFDAAALDFLYACAALVAPSLALLARAEHSPWVKMINLLKLGRERLCGAGHRYFKAVVALACLGLATLVVAPSTYRVAAPAAIEGAVQRAVVAPQAGYVAEASARAGDTVSAGQTLAALDTRDLHLARQKWESERAKHRGEHDEAFAVGDRVRVSILRARIAQVDAEIGLVAEQIARAHLTAPFAGVVASGDLSQSLGAPVERGQVLFEIAPLDDYRVVIEVDERDIAAVRPGQSGHLRLAGMPGEPLPVTVARITPMAIASEGRNAYRVEAHINGPISALRPGMRGIAKIEIGQRSWLWIWGHGTVDRLRLRAWSLGI